MAAPTDLTLTVSDNRLAVRLTCALEGRSVDDLLVKILEQMEHLALKAATHTEVWESRVREALSESESITDLLLVEGIPPVVPVPGRIQWAGDFFSEGFVIDPETGSIDFRERKAKPVIMSGGLIATVIPPIEGKEGSDVYGHTIPAGRVEWPRMRAGKNVEYNEETFEYRASANGRVRLQGAVLVVDEVLSLPGSVGLASGNIRHPGSLDIGKDIEPGSRVRADGDITVGGSIETADVDAGGNLSLRGGINGRGQESLRAGGSVHTRYLNETNIIAGGDVLVDNEIVHSNVQCKASVLVPNGRIIGGKVTARNLIDVKEAGSIGGVRTELTAGWSDEELRQIKVQRARIAQINAKVEEIHHTVEPLMARMNDLPSEKREMVTLLLAKAYELEQQVNEEKKILDELIGEGEPSIIIRGRLFSDTVLTVNGERLILREQVIGPLRAIAGPGRVKLLRAESKRGPD